MPEENSLLNSKKPDLVVNPVTLAIAKGTVWLFFAKTLPNEECLFSPGSSFLCQCNYHLSRGEGYHLELISLSIICRTPFRWLKDSAAVIMLPCWNARLSRSNSCTFKIPNETCVATRGCRSCCNGKISVV